MTFNFASYRIVERKTLSEILSIAEATYDDAKTIAADGLSAALAYARAWKEKHTPDTQWRKGRMEDFAKDVYACAKSIVANGKAWWVHSYKNGDEMLIVVSLMADASAGPVGYMPLIEVKTDAEGKIIEYAADHDVNGPHWAPAEPELFSALCRQCGLSISEAADYLKATEATVKQWSSGRRTPPAGVYREMADLMRAIEFAADAASREEVAQLSAGLPLPAAKAALARFIARNIS